ncbi:MAG: hypothetical protein ABR583_13510 [Gaiellaceae bacterium]
MADPNASAALGAPQVAGAWVNPKGGFMKMAVGGIGGINVIEKVKQRGADDLPNFGRVGYVAASEDEIALVKTKSGTFGMKMKVTDEVLARAPRSDIASAEMDKGAMISKLRIAFTNGVTWEFQVPKNGKKNAMTFVEAIGAQVH